MKNEEIREAIAKLLGIPLDQVPLIDFEAEKAKMREQYNNVQRKIEAMKPVLDKTSKTTADKYEELFDLGKFIIFFNEKFQILSALQKFPDFTLLYQSYRIGVEHTRLWSNEERAMFKAAKYYIAKAEEIIAQKLSRLSKTVNIFIDYNKTVIGDGDFNNRKFTPEQRSELPNIIANYIKSELTGGDVSKPDFISQVKITPNKDLRVDLELAESYFTQAEFSDLLLKRIANKERLADNYRNATKVNALWLLIVIDDVNSFSSFNLESARIPKIETSYFDSILVIEKFGGRIYLIFPNNA